MIIPKFIADMGRSLNRLYYRQLFRSIYVKSRQPPSWFDHRMDLYYLWPENLFWLERGVLPRRHMKPGCTVLDLFCGDGFFSRYFYSTIADHVDAVDKDSKAISHAAKWHAHPKVHYAQLDAVTTAFPRKHYDVIVWFEGIEHLDLSEYAVVIQRIKAAIGMNGLLVGSTPILPATRRGLAIGNIKMNSRVLNICMLFSTATSH